MLEMAMFNVQRAITPKVGKSELRFMCSARHPIKLYICVKYHKKYLRQYQSYGVDMNDGSTDGRMNTPNFLGYYIIPSTLCGGA